MAVPKKKKIQIQVKKVSETILTNDEKKSFRYNTSLEKSLKGRKSEL